MSTYPVAYHQTPAEDRSRLPVFFRFIMVIPHLIWSMFYGLGAFIVAFVAWFAIVFTGRYPEGMYNFVAGYVRFYIRLNGYMFLVTDEFPPFDGGEHPAYPIQVRIPPVQASYSRLTTGLRIFLLFPVYILNYAFSIWIELFSIAFWFVAVITGRTAASLIDSIRFPMAYLTRAYAYALLLTDGWPPIDD